MNSRILIVCTVLALLCWAGTAQAAPFTHGYANITGASHGGLDDAIYHCAITIPADNVPFIIVGYYARLHNSDASPTEAPPVKMALYSEDGATIIDTSEALGITSGTLANYPLSSVSHTQITSAGIYEIAVWGNQLITDSPNIEADSTTADTFWVMTSQPYGNAWPTLSDANAQVNKYLVAGIIGIKGDGGVVGKIQTDDAYIKSGTSADKNYGISPSLGIGGLGTPNSTFRCLNVLDNIPSGETIDACSLWINVSGLTGGDVDLHPLFKYGWGEGTSNGTDVNDGSVTWNDWACDASEWGTAGGLNTDDGGSDNTGDGTGADITATPSSTVTFSGTAWYGFAVSLSYVTGRDSLNVLLKPSSGSSVAYTISASESGSSWPVWQFYTSAAAEPGGTPLRRRRLLSGGN